MATSNREPEEPDRPPSDLDAMFAEIVAGWDREPADRPSDRRDDTPADVGVDVDQVDGERDGDDERDEGTDGPEAGAAGSEVDVLDAPGPDQDVDPGHRVDDAEDHFVPPEPPPLPFPAPHTLGAFALFGLGLLLLLSPDTLGLSSRAGLLLGLLSLSGGGIWLAAKLRQGPPTGSGWDDGAQV